MAYALRLNLIFLFFRRYHEAIAVVGIVENKSQKRLGILSVSINADDVA